MAQTAPPQDPPAISSFALMVCTYNRPERFQHFIAALRNLVIPEGLEFQLIVADNNPTSHYDTYIAAALDSLPFETSYGHEPALGYSNARNKALDLARRGSAEILAFCDDDLPVDRYWLVGHLKSFSQFHCDAVTGAIHVTGAIRLQKQRGDHGRQRPQSGMGNFAFKRHWITAEGYDLSFDPACNKTGFEDQRFTRAATKKGAIIIYSDYPIVYDHFETIADYEEEIRNKAWVTAITRRNKIVKLRQNGRYGAVFFHMLYGLAYGLKSLGHLIAAAAFFVLRQQSLSRNKRLAALKEFLKMTQSFKGLFGDSIDRQAGRRNK